MIELLPGDIEGRILRISPSFVSNGHWCVRKSALENALDFVDVAAYRAKVPLLGPIFDNAGGGPHDPREIGCDRPQENAKDITDKEMEAVFRQVEGFKGPRTTLDDVEVNAGRWCALASEDAKTWCFVEPDYLVMFEEILADGIFAPTASLSENFVEPFENATLIFDTDESRPWNVMILGARVAKAEFHRGILKAAALVERYREATK